MLKKTFANRIFLIVLVLSMGMWTFGYGEAQASTEDSPASFVVYYSRITEETVKHLATYDLAIIEPKATNDTYNSFLKDQGTEIYGYISTLQVETTDDYKVSRMTNEDYLMVDGQRVYIEKYDDYLGDIRRSSFRQVLLDTIDERIVKKGYDGVFLDTVDFTEYFNDADLNHDLQVGFIDFLAELKARFPDLKVFQNRGFKSYKLGGAAYLDYILYEDFRSEKFISNDYYSNLAKEINSLASQHRVKVAALSQKDELKNAQMAHAFNWMYYYSSYDNNYRGVEASSGYDFKHTAKVASQQVEHLGPLAYLEKEDLHTINLFLLDREVVSDKGLEDAVVRDAQGERVLVYGHYLMDMSSLAYQTYLIEAFNQADLENKEMLRLSYITSAKRVGPGFSVSESQQVSAYMQFMKNIKLLYPDLVLIQERGVDYLSEELAGIIDGLYWNNFDFDQYETNNWLQEKVDQLASFQENYEWLIIID